MVQTSPPTEAPPAPTEAGPIPTPRPAGPRRAREARRRRRTSVARAASVVLLVGLAMTGLLAWVVSVVNSRNETRLLQVQVREGATVIAELVSFVQTPLASAADIANATGGSVSKFEAFMTPNVTGPGHFFVAASLWQVSGGSSRLVASVGPPTRLSARPAAMSGFLAEAVKAAPSLAVTPILPGREGRIGFAYVAPGGGYAAYGEIGFAANHRTAAPQNSAFADLNFAVFLGQRANPQALVEATQYPLTGQTVTTTVGFGDSHLTLVGSALSPLGGALSNSLQWIVAGAGVALSLLAALLAAWLVRRRTTAEQLAEENQYLYRQQRSIAETLQRSLLPERLPEIPGIQVGARYVSAGPDVDVGGDWYDVIEVESGFLFVVGDVSGRGLRAATKMATLHHAIRAYAAEGQDPESILEKLGLLVDLERDGYFATVLCGHVDVARREVQLVDAGHLAPLVIAQGSAHYAPVSVGLPVGVPARSDVGQRYRTVTFEVEPGSTLLAFTDGLVERRNEDLDRGLERLERVAVGHRGSLEDLLSTVVEELVGNEVRDDTAVLGVRWLT